MSAAPGVTYMAYAATSQSITDRMIRAAKLDVSLYEEVETDLGATNQALTVVVLVALAQGIGAALGAVLFGSRNANPVGSLIGGVISALLGWAIWSFVAYFVGTRLFKGTATYGEVLRTTGFGYSPGVLGILSFIPVLGGLIAFAASIWSLVAGFIGLRQALDLDNGNTAATVIVSLVVMLAIMAVLALLIFVPLGIGAALLGGVAG